MTEGGVELGIVAKKKSHCSIEIAPLQRGFSCQMKEITETIHFLRIVSFELVNSFLVNSI